MRSALADTTSASEETPVRLRVVGVLPAGHVPTTSVGHGEAIRIMTGAPMPPGADAVSIVELSTPTDDDGVLVRHTVKVGDHVRGAGGDVQAGEVVFRAGTVIGPAHLGVLSSIGVESVAVVRRARVGVISTGDELVEHGPLTPGKIRDSNRPMLLALLADAGAQALDLGMARDDEASMIATLADALERCDAVVTSGGVSVGDFDFVHVALRTLAADGGGSFDGYSVAIRPAKPLAFGVVRGRPVFGLPGNPVSSRVSFELFARPALLHMMGHPHHLRPEVTAHAAEPLRRRVDGKVHLDRVRVRVADGGYVAESAGAQESNALAATAIANGLALLPDGEGVAAGEEVTVMLLDAAPDH